MITELDLKASGVGSVLWATADFRFGLGNKLMGQVNVVRFGFVHVQDGRSFTLTATALEVAEFPDGASRTPLWPDA